MRIVEVEGKTSKEAIKIALKKLGVPKSKVKIQILKEENMGLFGMEGAKRAKVRLTIDDKK